MASSQSGSAALASPGATHWALRPPQPTRPHWGGIDLLHEDGVLHFAVSGCTGSGKTLSIRQLMQSVLPSIRPDEDCRALIYDPKRDMVPFLYALGLDGVLFNMDPFDRRSVAWDIARDIDSSAAIEQFASIIIPPVPTEQSPFFTDAARILFRCTISALQARRRGQWDLRDVVLIMCNPQRLHAHLAAHSETREISANFFEAKEFPSIMSTIETKIRPLQVIAGIWSRTPRKVGLREQWLDRGSILLLADHPTYSRCLEPINRAILRFLSDGMLAKPNDPHRRSWVFLDELREAGRLDGLRKLLTQGREKGVAVVLGFQDIEGLRELYGKEGANELVGQCNHKVFLRTDNPETAVWMQDHINRSLLLTRQCGRDTKDGKTTTTDSLRIDHTVLASDFLGIPSTSFQHGMRGLHLSSRITKPYWFQVPLKTVLARLPAIPREVRGEIPRPESDQELAPWSENDAIRLDLVVPKPPPPPAEAEPSSETPSDREYPPAEHPEPPPGSGGGRGKRPPGRSPTDRLWASMGGRPKKK